MQQRIKYILATLAFCSVLAAVPIIRAESGTSTSSSTTTTSSNDTSPESEDKPTDKRSAMERISEHKAEMKVKLTEVEQEKIKTKCKIAQAAISSLHTKVNEDVTTRTRAYQKLLDRLNGAVTKLKAANVDTTKLEAEISTLSAKINTYKTDLANYRQAISDLKLIDCTTDPTAFKAALETARAKRETLSKTVQDIRAYLKDTIKATLVEIHSGLESKKESTSTTNNTSERSN